jgi:phosphoserine phosphatase RsbU/P
MDEAAKAAPFPLVGEADPVPPSLFVSHPEHATTLSLLYEVSREITSILDREELLRRVAERVKKIVDYDVFSVMLWSEKTQYLETAFAMRYGDAIASRERMPLHKGLTGTAAGQRRVVRVNDTRSELVVPLVLQDRLIGVLDLESAQTNAFTLEHERMLGTLASYIAIALENSRLFEAARDSERRLYEDLATAREIQRQLLPTGAREVPGIDLAAGYCSARELGGDFYDFLPYGQGRLALALGDVSGKGTAAALFGSLAIGIMREHVVEHPCAPAEMLSMLTARLHGARLESRFVALVFGVYDAGSRRLTFANAGAPYPLLVRDGQVRQLRVAGVPLGLFPEMSYDESGVELQPGDTLLFASDGIVESENHNQEEFGPERLAAVLQSLTPKHSAADIANLVLSATDEFSGGGFAPHDDRTLLVLRVTDHTSTDFSKLPIIY